MYQKKQIACICLLLVLTIENIFIISSRITPGNPYFAVCFAKTLFLNKTILMHNDIFAPATIFSPKNACFYVSFGLHFEESLCFLLRTFLHY